MSATPAQIFWQGIFPWLAAAVGGVLSALLSWLSVWQHYRGIVAAHTISAKDMSGAEKAAKDKLEGFGTFEPQFCLYLWRASVQPLFLLALLFPLGKRLSTDGPHLVGCVFLGLCALVVLLLHEFHWKETTPNCDTWRRTTAVGTLWCLELILAIWVACAPAVVPPPAPSSPAASALPSAGPR